MLYSTTTNSVYLNFFHPHTTSQPHTPLPTTRTHSEYFPHPPTNSRLEHDTNSFACTSVYAQVFEDLNYAMDYNVLRLNQRVSHRFMSIQTPEGHGNILNKLATCPDGSLVAQQLRWLVHDAHWFGLSALGARRF
ncbi:hypothetical protein BaRGS_00014728, partial [Batillaria attramentaria]